MSIDVDRLDDPIEGSMHQEGRPSKRFAGGMKLATELAAPRETHLSVNLTSRSATVGKSVRSWNAFGTPVVRPPRTVPAVHPSPAENPEGES